MWARVCVLTALLLPCVTSTKLHNLSVPGFPQVNRVIVGGMLKDLRIMPGLWLSMQYLLPITIITIFLSLNFLI